ncbi:hypothetical protein C7402_10384 [Paraburkholderia unamae]|uniref:Uncharacterized protein n=2 Tax=Paraburkholderia unamae TaxID=219649 RepID=A0ABX5KU61_9BURK|nr:hypothetical protein C7402_10384 [Paraburkholderia unamae]RAR55272.1 hypothetical protein C7401_12256 [Paraburkholderia unamae]CAG9267971.1 Flagellar hook-associated protein flgK [Paraburkholderia unamae]
MHLATAFGDLARLNLSMYGVVLAGAPETGENIASSRAADPFAWHQAAALPSLAVPLGAYAVALIDMALQTSATLNRLAFAGCVEMARQASVAITAIGSGAWIADAMTTAASEVPERSSSVAVEAPTVARNIAREVVDSAPADVLPVSRRRRSPSPRSRASS